MLTSRLRCDCEAGLRTGGVTVSAFDYDVIVVGSGFGESVAALRATPPSPTSSPSTGAVVNSPATEPLGVYEVRDLDGEIQARI
jgi:hypothetical protein